jgi:hypothetical protein
MSNFIGVPGSKTRSGHPIAVMGPQAAYFVPQLLWEVAVKSNGGTDLDFFGRGAVFGDLPYINLGRGIDFAYSATSGESDLIDIRVSRMCNADGSAVSRDDGNGDGFPDADGYEFDVNRNGEITLPDECVRFYKRVYTWTAVPTVASVALGCSGGPQSPNCHLLPETVKRYILRTHYGPVLATVLVGGNPYAVSRQRSTFFAELETAPPFALVNTPTVKSALDFQRLFNSMTGTFNWLYVDANDVGYIHSGLYPIRSAQVHPDLPSWGDGRFEWGNDANRSATFFTDFGGNVPYPSLAQPQLQGNDPLKGFFEWPGYLSFAQHPQIINPPRGTISSWNNNPAKGWWSADGNGTFGPTHRVDMLEKRLRAFEATGKKLEVGNMVEIMGDAGYTDLRGQEVLPLLLLVMINGPLSADQTTVLTMMSQWVNEGSSKWINDTDGFGAWRRDRDHDGKYDFRAQVVLMDAWYPHLIDKLLPQVVAHDGFTGMGRYDAPRGQGSAYQEGWFQYMKRVLQMALNTPGHTSYRQLKCADGTLTGCRAAVLSALDLALADLGGLGNQANWDGTALSSSPPGCSPGMRAGGCGGSGNTVEAYDAVAHTAISFIPVPTIHWVNRPTFQQAIEIKERRK